MTNNQQSQHPNFKRSRKTLRLTFQVVNSEIRLARYERLDMVTPPSIGARPEAGKHGGFWVELRDTNDRVLSHRILDNPLRDSIEVHAQDGNIERRFGSVRDAIFEVLLPDEDNAKSVVLMGDPIVTTRKKAKRSESSGILAQFEIPGRGKEKNNELK